MTHTWGKRPALTALPGLLTIEWRAGKVRVLSDFPERTPACFDPAIALAERCMATVQIALNDFEYSNAIKEALHRDGSHRVVITNNPDHLMAGVVVTDLGSWLRVRLNLIDPGRVIVIADQGSAGLHDLWRAGVRFVLFRQNSIAQAVLAISAVAIRLEGEESL